MDAWLHIVIRQLILYSLPVIISLTLVVWIETRLTKRTLPHPFFAIAWRGTWIPLLASLAWHRGIIIALPNSLSTGVKSATIRCISHAILCILGFILFSWSLAYPAPTGLPPLHHWWAKVLMFFNLCMVSLHLLPIPGLMLGEWLLASHAGKRIAHRLPRIQPQHTWIIIALLALSPLLDLSIGTFIIFPVYESISNSATHIFH